MYNNREDDGISKMAVHLCISLTQHTRMLSAAPLRVDSAHMAAELTRSFTVLLRLLTYSHSPAMRTLRGCLGEAKIDVQTGRGEGRKECVAYRRLTARD